LSESEVPDEAYVAAAIADRGFEVVRSSGGFDAAVRFKQPQNGYSTRGGVAVLTDRAREFMPYEESAHERNRPDDHPPAAELSAHTDPGECAAEAELKPTARKKRQNRPKA
jgi:hypothetical protein